MAMLPRVLPGFEDAAALEEEVSEDLPLILCSKASSFGERGMGLFAK